MSEPKRRCNFASGLAWEPLRGYSRAVQVGDHLYISGTTAINPQGDIVGPEDAYTQTMYAIQLVRDILRNTGFRMEDVVRTRLFVTDLNEWKNYARAHREAFEKIRPASSIVEVSRLMDPRMMVELEVEAISGCGRAEAKTLEESTG